MEELPVEEKWLKQAFTALHEFAPVPVPEDEWQKSIKNLRALSINKNEYFIKAGDIPDKLAFILKGMFRVFYLSESGDENTLVFRDEGRPLSAYSAFLEKTGSKHYFQALEDGILLYIPFKDWTELLSGHPYWRAIYARYLQILFIEKENRETEFLCNDAGTRYLTFVNKYPQIAKRVPHYHIASYLGITPEALSRMRKKAKLT
jgi:CRP-like cAMP-binding protein